MKKETTIYSTNMRYIIAYTDAALDAGFTIKGHRVKNGKILLNEKEVLNCVSMEKLPTLEEKCSHIHGGIYTINQIKEYLEKEGWNYE